MNAFLLLVPPAALGTVLLRALGVRWRDDPIGVPAWCWLAGCLVLGACVQLGLELHLPPAWWWAPVVLAMAGLGVAARRRAARAAPTPAAPTPPPDLAFRLFVCAGVLGCLWFAAAGMDRPCIEGDEGNIWSLKAKSLLVDWPDRFAMAQVHNLHPDYPQLNPLLQAWAYACANGPDFLQFENRWLVQLCDVALFVAVAAALRRRLPAWSAALGSLLLLGEPEFQNLLRTAYADGMLALGLVVAVDGYLRHRETGERRWLWLAALGLPFALWAKNETMLYVASAGAAALLVRRWQRPEHGSWRANLALLAPAAVAIANTAVWNRRFGMQSDLLGANPTGKSMFALMAEQWRERVPAMVAEFARTVASLQHAHVVFGVLLLGVALAPRRVFGTRLALPALALAGALFGLHVVYVGSFLPLRFHLDTSYTRVTFQLLPAALVLLAALVSDVVGTRANGHTGEAP